MALYYGPPVYDTQFIYAGPVCLQDGTELCLQNGESLQLQLVPDVVVTPQASRGGRVKKKSKSIYVEVDGKRWFFDTRAQAVAFLQNIADEVGEELTNPVSKIRVAPGKPAPIVTTNAPRTKAVVKKAQKAIKRRIYNALPQIEAGRQKRIKRRREEELILLLM